MKIKETIYEYEIKEIDGDMWHTKNRKEAIKSISTAASVERRKRIFADDGNLLVDDCIEVLK